MKQSGNAFKIAGAIALLALVTSCTTTSSTTTGDTPQKEAMLTQAGFVSKAVTTPKQQAQVEKLSVGVVSAVKYQGKLLYVYPTAKKDQVLIGKQAHFDAYKKMLAAKASASTTQPAQAQNDNGAYLTGETAGPNRIIVQEFDGFGPIQDNPAWQ